MIKNQNILNYRIVGNGYPVVFLHGFLESNSMWKSLLPELEKIRAICIELPGHGESPLLSTPLQLETITDSVKSTIKSLNIEQFSIVGHSLGGYVALHLAEDKNLNIDRLTLLHSHPWADPKNKKRDRDRVAKIVEYNELMFLNEAIPSLYYEPQFFETKINQLIEEANEMSEQAIIQTLIAMRDREEKVKVLEDWKDKISIIQGEFDSLIDAQKLEKLAEENRNEFNLIRSIGHMGHHENKIEVARLVNSFVSKI